MLITKQDIGRTVILRNGDERIIADIRSTGTYEVFLSDHKTVTNKGRYAIDLSSSDYDVITFKEERLKNFIKLL